MLSTFPSSPNISIKLVLRTFVWCFPFSSKNPAFLPTQNSCSLNLGSSVKSPDIALVIISSVAPVSSIQILTIFINFSRCSGGNSVLTTAATKTNTNTERILILVVTDVFFCHSKCTQKLTGFYIYLLYICRVIVVLLMNENLPFP
nr:odorant binding protein 18 [Pagiophloeus tsushimanus]